MAQDYVRWLENVSADDVDEVGGKNASLGEMLGNLVSQGVRVPDGFATTATAYRTFLEANELPRRIGEQLSGWETGDRTLEEVGAAVRDLFGAAEFPDDIASAIRDAYAELGKRYDTDDVDVAVRSSATAEDLPDASFAGQQDTYLNVTGAHDLLAFCKDCYASLFTDRAISYRAEQGFDHTELALSIGVQKMVRSDRAGAGVMFTIDTDTGFPRTMVLNAAWGLGENVVGGEVTPDQYTVFKPFLDDTSLTPVIDKVVGSKEKKMVYADDDGASDPTVNQDTTPDERAAFVLDDAEILQLARWGATIERHYDRPMDIEWAKDGRTGDLFVVQARPETVQSQADGGTLASYSLKESGDLLLTGLAVGQAIGAGPVQIIASADQIEEFTQGSVLVTRMTDPDWVPIMRKAAAIVTDRGGRTSHAAIVSRELGVPAIVGAADATSTLDDGRDVTVSCVEGDEGRVYDGILDYERSEISLDDVPEVRTRVMMNIGNPSAALRWWQLPARGIGLARMEYLVNNVIKAHPLALIHYDELDDQDARKQIGELTTGYEDKCEYFVDHLARGLATVAASQYPEPVVVRLSDFKSNEYAGLIGGTAFEPEEENPMLGWRGASRYYSEEYREAFGLECRALRRVRSAMGFTNVIVMVPFCRTPDEADKVLAEMAEHDLRRGEDELKVYVMAEIPSNVLQADEFADRFDGFSIGSNDLTQLALGIGRDDERLMEQFDERSPSVKRLITMLIGTAHEKGLPVGICGQGPSDHPDLAQFLVEQGIDTMSLNPDSVLEVVNRVAEAERAGS